MKIEKKIKILLYFWLLVGLTYHKNVSIRNFYSNFGEFGFFFHEESFA
jgi:hypothetical protein